MRFSHVLLRLARTPTFTAVVIVTLAISIGANTAIFSAIEGVLLKPLPYSHAEELIDVDQTAPGVNLKNTEMAPFLYFTYRDHATTFRDLGMWNTGSVSVTGLGDPEQVSTLQVTWSVLPMLGVQPALGRLFSRTDDSPGTPETAILTFDYWQRKFGGDRGVVGRRIIANGSARDIVGVLPRNFQFLNYTASILTPMQLDRSKVTLGGFSYHGMARLRPGVSLAQATADVARMIPIALRSFPPYPGFSMKMFEDARLGPNLTPLKQSLIGDIGNLLLVLMGTIGMVLLIACANVANLLLVRSEGRQHELAIRAALGADRRRIAGELLFESVTLGVLGGTIGLGFAYGLLRLLIVMTPANLPRRTEIGIDGPVLLFTLAVSLLTGVIFGLIPVLKYAAPRIGSSLRAGGRSLSESRERHRARSILVVVQVALALVLLIGSGLMIRTFQALKKINPGFTKPEDVLTVHISIPPSEVRDPIQAAHAEENILDRIASVPGVQSAAVTTAVPIAQVGEMDPIFVEGRDYTASTIPPLRHFRYVSPGLPKSLGNTLVAGRDFTWTDVYGLRPLVMVSDNMARELWGSPVAALGKRIRQSPLSPWFQVIGVVGDERDDGVNQPVPAIVFWPVLIKNSGPGDPIVLSRNLAYIIRSPRTGSNGFLNEVNRAVWSVNPNLPVAGVRTLQDIYNRSLARTSFTLVMLAIAGGMALLLGIVGIYGVMSYSVSQRTREIGIRIALGARNESVTRMFVAHGLRLAIIGIASGLGAAFALTRLMKALLFEVKPVDPFTWGLVSILLVLAAASASYGPALRATKVDPVEALRAE